MGGNAGKGKKPERTMKNSNAMGGAGAPMRGWRGGDKNDKHESI